MDSPFEILRIDPDAEEGEIRQAYRDRVKEAHPDHGGSAREFRRVTEAYRSLISEGWTDSPTEDAPDPPDTAPEEDEPTQSHVEYLNYSVLTDMGWSLEDGSLFEKSSRIDLDTADHGRMLAPFDAPLLRSAESCGFTWPFACRGGACANCAVAVKEGELSQPVNHILPSEMIDRGIRLSCVGKPLTDTLKVVYNVKHLPPLDDLRLPARSIGGVYNDD